MDKETQEKLLSEVKRQKAVIDARQRAKSAGHDRHYSIPTDEDVSAIKVDKDDWRIAEGAGWRAFHHFLAEIPLFLVGPGVVEPISASIVKGIERNFYPYNIPSIYVPHLPFLTKDQFTVSAKEVVEMADAAKILNSKAANLGFATHDLQILNRMISLGTTATTLLPYEGFALSVRESDVPKARDIERVLLGRNRDDANDARPKGRPRLQEEAAEAFYRLFPDGRGNTSWKQVTNELAAIGVDVSQTTLKRAIGQKS